jgi:hypothetical protein
VFVLDVADVISARLGEPTVTALPHRFGPGGRCLTCGGALGSGPLSVRAYHNDQETVTLVAYHAGCATSAWLEVGAEDLRWQATWAAVITCALLPIGKPRRLRWLRGPGTQELSMPLLLVHPSLETARVRHIGPGEAVNADLEDYCRLGFAESSALARAYPLRPVGSAWMGASETGISLMAMVGERGWSAPVRPQALAGLVTVRGGILIGVTCDRDPQWLGCRSRCLNDAIADSEILLGWAPLAGALPQPG